MYPTALVRSLAQRVEGHHARAIELLEQRVVLATAVVRELQRTGGQEI